ncbi:uncharacterized protein LOC101743463 [Bombyx mori]|uniref:Uncharacterized protein n=1 Tax=Bombyx mori TaxID=7091 RepID=A0A8R1WM27_BOMMO|nr:uncharacterized protein LOC101743463 [Bombyx mori]
MLDKELLDKCYFIPKDVMLKVLAMLESSTPWKSTSDICRRNLASIQGFRSSPKFRDDSLAPHGLKSLHHLALNKAIYAQDWDKLLYVLKKIPPWKFKFSRPSHAAVYYRAMTILLLNHPTAQANSLMNEFLHMVLSCRSDADKKAILKILLSLPSKRHTQ